MKLTKSTLKRLIREELEKLQEQEAVQPGYEIDVIQLEKADKKGNVFSLEYVKTKGDAKSADIKVKVDSKFFTKTIQGPRGMPIEVRLSIGKNKTPGADKDPAFRKAPIEGELIITKNGKEQVKPWSPAVERYVNNQVKQVLSAPEFKELDKQTQNKESNK